MRRASPLRSGLLPQHVRGLLRAAARGAMQVACQAALLGVGRRLFAATGGVRPPGSVGGHSERMLGRLEKAGRCERLRFIAIIAPHACLCCSVSRPVRVCVWLLRPRLVFASSCKCSCIALSGFARLWPHHVVASQWQVHVGQGLFRPHAIARPNMHCNTIIQRPGAQRGNRMVSELDVGVFQGGLLRENMGPRAASAMQ